MKKKKEVVLDVDFIGGVPFTEEDSVAFSAFFRSLKEKKELRNATQKRKRKAKQVA